MIFKILLIVIFWLIFQSNTCFCNYSIVAQSNCLIHNLKYSNEYLYASNNIFTTGLINIKNPHHNMYTIPIESVDDYSKLKWTLQQVNNSNDIITIKSSKDEYLCGSNLYHDVFRHRRRVYLKM